MKIACKHFALGLKFTVSFFLIILIDIAQKRDVLIELICFKGFILLLWQKLILE